MSVNVQIGKSYNRRDGSICTISSTNPHDVYCFKDTNGELYTENGFYYEHRQISPRDLISEIASVGQGKNFVTLEVGGMYRDGRGKTVKIVSEDGSNYPFDGDNNECYTAEGKYSRDGADPARDLVVRLDVPGAVPPRTIEEFGSFTELEEGRFYQTRDGSLVGPMVLRDPHSTYPFSAKKPDTGMEGTWRRNGIYDAVGSRNRYDLLKVRIDRPSASEGVEGFSGAARELVASLSSSEVNIGQLFSQIAEIYQRAEGVARDRRQTVEAEIKALEEARDKLVAEIEQLIARADGLQAAMPQQIRAGKRQIEL